MAKPRKLVIGIPRTGEKDESEVRWLISYSDFMMQLVCVFILLYSVSTLDKGRMARVAEAYRSSVGMGDPAAHEQLAPGARLAIGDRSLLGGEVGGGDVPRDLRYRIEPVPGGLRAVFDAAVFDAGSSEPTPKGAEAIDAVAKVARAYAGRSAVTAAGDGAGEADPLRLALARSRAVADRLAKAGLDVRFLTTAGNPAAAPRTLIIEVRTE
jgi:flagellar motor protein MotB